MRKKKPAVQEHSIRPRLRVMNGSEIALGPGRIELLELIRETGSLQSAAKRMGISYMRAWQMIKFSNRCFTEPLVEAVRGGKTGGGATLTKAGNEAVDLYRSMEAASQKAMKQQWTCLEKLLRKSSEQ